MRSARMLPGRRLLAVLEPGEEVLASLAALCERNQFTAAGTCPEPARQPGTGNQP